MKPGKPTQPYVVITGNPKTRKATVELCRALKGASTLASVLKTQAPKSCSVEIVKVVRVWPVKLVTMKEC